ncbi:MAG: precorrin-8X methylmutase [Desulfatiglans sp.]|jgi:precorrin-8X/cobalt-precorrin-8 methylmutase|nr:precorrin-8X methylmutase [Thermodesulfobacteriota bacterium]MEE4353006.1 precorrin-8X methylmutase [Desulfatiglans sp.]
MSNKSLYVEPNEIESRSFAIIDSEVPEPRPFKKEEWQVARRMIHTTADFELLSHIRFHSGAIAAGIAALKSGCLIVTDTEMARVGIPRRRMERLHCRVRCYLNEPAVIERASQMGQTRAAAAVDYASPELTGSISVIGNAPTALLRLLEIIKKGQCRPALIVGMPVGFVNAAESKEILLGRNDPPFITIKGRKGGSALAACVVNQLAEIALEEKKEG